MSTGRFLRRATCHHQMLFQQRFKLTLFSKQTSFLKMMSMNTLKFIPWLRIVLAKDLLINSDQEVLHHKWFSSTYLRTWLTEGREDAEDRTSWPAQQVTKDTYLRMHSFHQARRCYHRFQTHFLLSLSISDSVSHFLSCQKKKRRKFIPLHCSSTRAHHYQAVVVSVSNGFFIKKKNQTTILVQQIFHCHSQQELRKCGVHLVAIWESSHKNDLWLNMHHTMKKIFSKTSFKWRVKAGSLLGSFSISAKAPLPILLPFPSIFHLKLHSFALPNYTSSSCHLLSTCNACGKNHSQTQTEYVRLTVLKSHCCCKQHQGNKNDSCARQKTWKHAA